MRSSTILAALLPAAVSAHFSINYPPSRGDNDKSQGSGPCGGLDTPSEERTPYSLEGGQLSFQAGHDEANTAVYLALGNNPKTEDFDIIVKDKFLQVGLGTFCWNDLKFPDDLDAKVGDNATLQVVQQGHSGGGLYNCIDITFAENPANVKSCSNGTGVTAEASTATEEDHSGHSASSSASSASASESADASSADTAPSSTASAASDSGASVMRVAGGAVFAAVLGAIALL